MKLFLVAKLRSLLLALGKYYFILLPTSFFLLPWGNNKPEQCVFEKPMEFPQLAQVVSGQLIDKLVDFDSETVKEVQILLHKAKIYHGEIDGVVGDATLEAFTLFKKSVWLGEPHLLGSSTAAALLEIEQEHQLSEQNEPIKISTGNSMTLPDGSLVYEDDDIIPGIPLTWGEITKGCTRIPESKEIVSNICTVARGFGKIRQKYNSPLMITSAYRPLSVNRAVGGAKFSQHINGLALDICPSDGNLQKLFEICRDSDCVGLGRGMHRGFVHVDWRSGGRVIFDYS